VRPEPKHFLRPGSEHTPAHDYDRAYFGHAPPATHARGEKSTTYIERPDAARRILAFSGRARFLAVLRDPVERAISNYRFSVQHGIERLAPEEALTETAQRRPWDPSLTSTSPFGYLSRGRYADQLDRWAAAVGRDNLRIVLFEQLIGDPQLIAGVHRFLGVHPEPVRVPARPVNASTSTVPDVAAVRPALRRYFAVPTRRLGAEWGVDVARWWASARVDDQHRAECDDLGGQERDRGA
jgi:hypothetical protein